MTDSRENPAPGLTGPGADIFQLSESAIVLRASREYSAGQDPLALQRRIWILDAYLRNAALPWVDIVIGLHNITVNFDGPPQLAAQWRSQLEQGWQHAAAHTNDDGGTGRQIELEVCYGGEYGPDLDAVCRHSGLNADSVIELHSQASYTVAFIGFQPGFPYLLGLPEALHCPRKRKPVQQLAAGSVAIGGPQTGIYPASSPGGWQVIGRLAEPHCLFQPAREPAVLLRAADQLRFIPR